MEVKFFNAKWCGPCKQMKPHIDKLVKEGYSIEEIDIDDFPESINIVPTLQEAKDIMEMEAIERDLGF